MEKLVSHISFLIARYDCVIVPGIGAFLAYEVAASYNSREKIFMPPYRTLGFNPQVTIDDALLLSQYISVGNMTYDDALFSMRRDIDALRSSLQKDGLLRFGTLGTFTMNIKGEIAFTPDANGIDDPYNFAFEPLAIDTLEQCDNKNIVIPIKRRDFGKYVAAAAAIILTFLFVTPVSDNVYKNDNRAAITDFASQEQISMMQQLVAPVPEIVDDVVAIEIAPVNFTTTNVVVSTHEEPVEPIVEQQPQTLKVIDEHSEEQGAAAQYYIIVASSPNAANAELAVKELTTKMCASYEVLDCGKRHRVAVDSFSSAADAQNALSQYQQTFPDAWVLFF